MFDLTKTLLPVKITRISLKVIFTVFAISMLVISIASLLSINKVIASFDVEEISSKLTISPADIGSEEMDLDFYFPIENEGRFPLQDFTLTMKIIIEDDYVILDHTNRPRTINPGISKNIHFRADEDDYDEETLEEVKDEITYGYDWNSLSQLDTYGIDFEIFLIIETEYAYGLYSFQICLDVWDLFE